MLEEVKMQETFEHFLEDPAMWYVPENRPDDFFLWQESCYANLESVLDILRLRLVEIEEAFIAC